MTFIRPAFATDYGQLISVWEAAVRATHDFLPEADIATLKSLILDQYFDAVSLYVARQADGHIVGFCGALDGNLEMLFVCPTVHHCGIGKQLCQFAISDLHVTRVDVNEQNPAAIGFYRSLGFVPVGRSDLDGQGNPYPLVHMALASEN